MPSSLQLYQIFASPNSYKIRIALGYKGLDYETIDVNPMDRARVLEISGQPLAPVLVHEGAVTFDSGAILRYLDANFQQTLSLFPANIDAFREVEKWELWSKTDLAPAIHMIFQQAFVKEKNQEQIARANDVFNKACRTIELALVDNTFVGGESLTASDVILAPLAYYGNIAHPKGPVQSHFQETLCRDPSYTRVTEWVQRVLAYDEASTDSGESRGTVESA